MTVYLITHSRLRRLVIRASGNREDQNWGPIVHTIVQRLGQAGEADPVSIELGTLAELQQRHGARFTEALTRFDPATQLT